ncbi:MAG: Stk1 family PASTA domain-containing Ser/Thr kinase [Acidimicrobiia bacterium]|nr:Stk1 family PASTA domain-containing Ser/Thr kinase [Acidimicrobiia bacterium]
MESGHLLAERYELISHIARGGMADVWQAQDRALNRRVAVKVLHPQYSNDDSFVRRFRREAQAAANLSHPNIVSIFDWGQEDATYFIVMELIEGRSLRDILRSEGPLLPRRATEIASEVAAALAVAHQAGLVHRDVKPGNILITRDGTVKVTDFGIARAWDDSQELTRTGAVIGTATYFSPEQAQGIGADARSDLYSLGIVLYEMLVGAPPFKGDSPVAVAYQHVSAMPMAPTSVSPDVPAGLEAIVLRSLEKQPERRYQSATDQRADLLSSLRGDAPVTPASARPVPQEAPTRVLTGVVAAPPTAAPTEAYREVEEEPPNQIPFILTAFAMLAALSFGVWLLFQGLGIGGDTDATAAIGDTAIIPIVANMSQQEAINAVAAAGFVPQLENRNHATVAAGTVIESQPGGGTQLVTGEQVTIVVSVGTATTQIPSVAGLSEADAIDALENAELLVGSVTRVPSADIEEGVATGTNPASGATHPVGGTVELFVSSGPGTFLLEDYSGQLYATVLFRLESAGLSVLEVRENADLLDVDFVIRTEPASGEVRVGSTITVFVSDGPEPREVPNLIGATVEDATAQLNELGLVLEVSPATITVEDPLLDGLIADQFPLAPGEALPGDTITVILGVLDPGVTTTTTTVPTETTVTAPPATTTTTVAP